MVAQERDVPSTDERAGEKPAQAEGGAGGDSEREGGDELWKRGLADAVEVPGGRGSVEQRREQPDRDGFPAAEHRGAGAPQRNQRGENQSCGSPSQDQRRISQPAVPRLAGEQPRVKQDEQGAGAEDNPADHRPISIVRCYVGRTGFQFRTDLHVGTERDVR